MRIIKQKYHFNEEELAEMENTFFQSQDYLLAEEDPSVAGKNKESDRKPSEKRQYNKNELNQKESSKNPKK